MTEPDFETKQKTLRLRDAFRVLAWEVFETNPKNRENLNLRYTKFYSRWVGKGQDSIDELAPTGRISSRKRFVGRRTIVLQRMLLLDRSTLPTRNVCE